ncbi:hypothetical protein IT408_01175 [Candidatus Uhrbacteria bacterium]|nr:hypothetical protein [Candidatus Uhrbacteria bacterium]
MIKSTKFKFVIIVVSFVFALVGFAGSTKAADPDPCDSLQVSFDACKSDAGKDCKDIGDRVTACISKATTCVADLSAAMAADPKCQKAVDDRRKDSEKVVAPKKVTPLVCDAPAMKKSKGFGCECPANLFPVSVWGKPGHVSCASPKDLTAEVVKIQREMSLLNKRQLTSAERGELKTYEERLSQFYVVSPKTGDSMLPNYAKLFGEWEIFKAAFDPWQQGINQRISRLEGRMDATEAKLGELDGRVDALEKRGKGVFVRPTLGGELIFRKGGDTVISGPQAGAGLYAPIGESTLWFVRGGIGYGRSSGLGSIGIGRAGTGFDFAFSEVVTLGPELYFRFIGRYDSLNAKDGATLVKGGYGGLGIGVAANFHVRFNDIVGLGLHAGLEGQNNEWATCTTSKSCYKQESGVGGSFGANLTFSFGAPPLR